MECPSCYENFNEKERTPRNLVCGHTFCEKCLNLIQATQLHTCPICRKAQLPFKASDLPKNFIALELAQKQNDQIKVSNFCKTHPTESLRFYCITCSFLICPDCIVEHSGHQFIKHTESCIITI
jgi:kelch-like protein 10